MKSMKLGTVISAVVWLGCWTIPVITGTPVRTDEMERAFGPPLSEDELMSTPVFGKSGTMLFSNIDPIKFIISMTVVS